MLPFTVRAVTSASKPAGNSTVMLPFTVSNSSDPSQFARPIAAMIDPFTVEPCTSPEALSSTSPFTVWPAASPLNDRASTSPFTVRPTKFTPAGTDTMKCTLTSLSLIFIRPRLPGRHSFGLFSLRAVGYTAQIVTPSVCSSTSNSLSSAEPRLCSRKSAVTSTSLPEPATARMSPFIPLTSMWRPAAMRPRHSKPCWSAADT